MSRIRFAHIKSRQAGFTLIELVMALAVGGLIMAAAGTTLWQVWNNNRQNTAHMMAVKQVENALHFLVRDVQMAQTLDTTLSGDDVLKVTWLTWDAVSNNITYSWSAGDRRLVRTQTIDGTSSTVAYAVDQRPDFALPDGPDGKLVVNMTAAVQGARETRVVEILRRSGG